MNCRLLAAGVLFAIPLLAASRLRAEPPAAPRAAEKHFVTVELTVVEVSLTKLQALGFDWEIVGKKSPDLPDPAQFKCRDGKQVEGFLNLLKQYNLGQVVCNPKLMTLSGRPASLAIDDHLRLDVVPIVLGSGRIRVEHRLELPARKLKTDSAVEVESGQAVIASQVRSEKKDAAGKVSETATLVVVRADTGTQLK